MKETADNKYYEFAYPPPPYDIPLWKEVADGKRKQELQ